MADIEHRHLRSALEFAVLIAAEGQKRRPPLEYPKELKAYFSRPRLPTGALGRVRRAIEADDRFRSAISAGAIPDLVDEIGQMWLANDPDWEMRAAEEIAAHRDEAESEDLHRELKRADKRRVAAEQAATRIQAELLGRIDEIAARQNEIDDVRADLVKANDEITELRAELIDTRNELRHARDREAAARSRAEVAAAGAARAGGRDVASERDGDGDGPGHEPTGLADAVDHAELLDAAAAARQLVARLEALLPVDARRHGAGQDGAGQEGAGRNGGDGRRRSRPARRPLALPGGVISTSAEAAAHLVRTDALVLIDGYNVAKLAWPDRSLEQQRDALIARCENLARRHSTDLTIVFDGSSIVGAHVTGRRSVRVHYSPEGVTADDVIRAEVADLAADRAVVVVTNDREIVDDVRGAGANVVPSNAFLAVL